MKIIKENNLNILVAEEGKHIRSKNDVYKEEHIEEGILVQEHYPYYSERIYLPPSITESDIEKLYVEEDINE